ncbi:hypothetical protein L1987_27934 [Smallanthus sonchifolius]|uniref:Uncharacterized protein n=1 Tax=Smallanthus sonchifolius TaxID=185202 RepID=A0ACB9IDE8_9ASTR|nr:hypothetical protein L1987_27934 [Smallanthus sonchifolius]
MPYERVVKIRMVGLPIVLREEKVFREIAGLYGKVIEPFEFSWDSFDVSSGSCLVLHESGIRIDEEIILNWNNRSYPVWVKEVEHLWPPELKDPIAPAMAGDKDGDGTVMVDLEEGEIRPVVPQNFGTSLERELTFPPFPDLNNQATSYPGAPDGNISIKQEQSDGNFGEESYSVVPETLPVGDPVDIDKEVADTIEVGKCVGIQIEDFEDQVRLLIHGEGVIEGNQ